MFTREELETIKADVILRIGNLCFKLAETEDTDTIVNLRQSIDHRLKLLEKLES